VANSSEPEGDGADHPVAAWNVTLAKLLRREDLDADQAEAAMADIMAGRVGPARIAAFLVALRAKGESAPEVGAAAAAMRAAAQPWPGRGTGIDIVGTGGDNSGSVNISTLTAVIVAAAGVRVIKHGNRAATSASGAADVLEQVGLPLDLLPTAAGALADETGLGFAFAPVFHPAMRHAAAVRRELGVPTVFNVLGPLTNPARPVAGLIGCADLRMAPIMAEVFGERGEAMVVVRGEDGWDEITPQAPTRWWLAESGEVVEGVLQPGDLDLDGITGTDLAGGSAAHNAEVMRACLGLPRTDPGLTLQADIEAVRRVSIANAAGALAAAQRAGMAVGAATVDRRRARDWPDLVVELLPTARAAVESGAAGTFLLRWLERARALATAP
jgi:anthranilate phosphoribosyltransferase